MNLAENLARTARARGRFPALALGDEVTTFGEVEHWSRRVAGLLAADGVRAGDPVGLALPDGPELAAVYYGILRLGAVVVPMGPDLAERDVQHRLQDSGSRVVVTAAAGGASARTAARALGVVAWSLGAGGLADLLGDVSPLDHVVPRTADDPAVIVYTAGVTGTARGATLTHGNLLRTCEVVVNDLLQLTSDDVVLGGLTLSHPLGQTAGLHAAVRAGACLVLLAGVDAGAALDALRERGVTVMQGAPALYEEVLRHPRHADLGTSRLRVCLSGGAAMPATVLLGFEEAFDCLLLEGYGLAETAFVASSNRRDRRRVGSVGVPVTGVEMRVLDDVGTEVEDGERGEIVVRGRTVMSGYWARPDETAAALVDGWLRTADIGVRDEDGFFYVVDRVTDRGAAPTSSTGEILTRAIRLETRA